MSSSNSAGGGGSAAAAAAAAAGKNKGGAAGAKGSKALSTSAKRIQKELAEITVDPPPNCRYWWSPLLFLCGFLDSHALCYFRTAINLEWSQMTQNSWPYFIFQRRPQGWQHLRVGFDHPGPSRLGVRRRRVLPWHPLFARVPVQASQGDVQDTDLPLQHQQPGRHLSRHPQRQLEPGSHRLQSAPLSLFPPHRL